MKQATTLIVTDAELLAALGDPSVPAITCPPATIEGPRIARTAWVDRVAAGAGAALPDAALCELATEVDPAGTLATINALLDGLALCHADDAATLAAVMAVRHFHLPNLLDGTGR